MVNYFEYYYYNVIRNDMLRKFQYQNVNSIPKIAKIIVSMGVKDAALDKRNLVIPAALLESIVGQKVMHTKAKKSISNFKVREGNPIGLKCTLRGNYMYLFLQKLLVRCLPNIRDCLIEQGTCIESTQNRSFSFGLDNINIFSEVEFFYGKFKQNYGLNITLVTTCKSNEELECLLTGFLLPLNKTSSHRNKVLTGKD